MQQPYDAQEWEVDKQLADRFERHARAVLADHFIRSASRAEDQEEATDLRVFAIDPIRVAWRHRSARLYLTRFPFDVTIRYGRPSGVATEYQKIVRGWGDYFMYSFGDDPLAGFEAWRLLDLSALRRHLAGGRISLPSVITNQDGTRFMALDVRRLPEDVQLAKWRRGRL